MDEKEEELFRRLQRRSKERRTIKPVPVGEQIGLHPEESRELCRKWKNSGLVDFSNPNQIWLTEDGKEVEL